MPFLLLSMLAELGTAKDMLLEVGGDDDVDDADFPRDRLVDHGDDSQELVLTEKVVVSALIELTDFRARWNDAMFDVVRYEDYS